MEYVKLGNTGLDVSRIVLGCMSYGDPTRGGHPWSLPAEESEVFLRKALDLGITVFDTANSYSEGTSEEIVGGFLNKARHRDDVVIATKVYGSMGPGPAGGGLSRKAIIAQCEASLRRLQTDYIDLYQIHRWDDSVPVEETLETLDSLVKAGKVRYLGASSMAAWQFSKALYTAERNGWSRFVSMQNHYNLLYREEENEMLPLCQDQGIGVLPWSPLARGRLTRPWATSTARTEGDTVGAGLYDRQQEADHAVVDRVAAIAQERGVPQAHVGLAWLFSTGYVTAPIVGATKPHHLDDAVAALSFTLTDDEVARLEQDYVPHERSGF